MKLGNLYAPFAEIKKNALATNAQIIVVLCPVPRLRSPRLSLRPALSTLRPAHALEFETTGGMGFRGCRSDRVGLWTGESGHRR